MIWYDINGSIQADVNEKEFNQQFLEFIESKGWSFAGSTSVQESEED